MPAAPVGTPPASPPAGAASASLRRAVRCAHALAFSALILTGACARGSARAEQISDQPTVHSCRQIVPADAVVRWVEPEARGDRDELSRWCETIGPILIQPLSVQPHAAPIDRLAAYLGRDGGYVFCNIHNLLAEIPPEKVIALYRAARTAPA